jgi:DNA-binding MarR family transcriptional regulator
MSSNDFTKAAGPVSPPGPPLIGALLRRPLEAVRRHMLERLHAAGFDDIEPVHLSVLQYPGPHGLRPSELAAQLRMSKQALNYQLGELERLGYLERRQDPADLRTKRIVLTRRGAAIVPVIRAAVGEVEAAWAGQLGHERFAELRASLIALNSVV